MKHWARWVLLMVVVAAPAVGQTPQKKSSIAKLAGKLADSTLMGTAAGLVDGALGTAAGGGGCPAGTVPTAAGPGVVGLAPMTGPSAGSAIVQAARRKLAGGKKPDPAATAAPQIVCVSAAQSQIAAQQQAAMQAAQQQAAAAQAPGMGSMAKGLAAATPVGAIMAAAPVAGMAAKAIGSFLKGKGPNKESMIKELAKGRLVLKGVKFLPASDALEAGFEDDLAALAEALSAMSGEFLLNVPAEAISKTEVDTTMARRRLDKLVVNLQVAGVSTERLTVVGIYPPQLDPKKKAPKPGEVEVEVLRLPKGFKP